jgi:hypothetical protein
MVLAKMIDRDVPSPEPAICASPAMPDVPSPGPSVPSPGPSAKCAVAGAFAFFDVAWSSEEEVCITLESSQEPQEGLLDEIYKLPVLDETHNGIMKAARCKALIPSKATHKRQRTIRIS